MANNKEKAVKIKKVKGDVVVSHHQQGGITAHTVTNNNKSSNYDKKSFFNRNSILLIGLVASVLTILGYFGLQPQFKADSSPIVNKPKAIPKLQATVKKDSTKKDTPTLTKNTDQSKKLKKKAMSIFKKDANDKQPVVHGDLVQSFDQKGGITAHTVIQNFGKPIPQARHLSQEDAQRLNALNKEYKIEVVISMKNDEANNFGREVCGYLQQNGYTVELSGYMMGVGGSNNRFDINVKDGDKSISIFVPTQE